jgi:hypothetical protein
MFLQRTVYVSTFPGLGVVLLLLLATVDMGQNAYAKEIKQQPPDTIDEIVSRTVDQESSETIEEIVVYGDKPLHALRRELYRSEENFFDVFSSLNEDDDYDVRCFYEIPSFTHIRRHVCRAKFVIDATSAESAVAFSKQIGAFSRPAAFEIQRKKERLREIIEALVAEHPELLQALNEYTDKKQILESEKERR